MATRVIRAAPETDILLGLTFDIMNSALAGEAGGREADGGTREETTDERSPFGPSASPASPPGALPERLRLLGRVSFRVFCVFRGKVSRQVNDINPPKKDAETSECSVDSGAGLVAFGQFDDLSGVL